MGKSKFFVIAGVVAVGAMMAGVSEASSAEPPEPSSSDDVGLTVVLTPAGTSDSKQVDRARQGVKARIKLLRRDGSLDVTGMSVSLRGRNIVVRLSGVSDPSLADELIPPPSLQFRPVLANVGAGTKPGSSDITASGTVGSCDAAAITALTVIPTTEPAADLPERCVVLPLRGGKSRLLLGPAVLIGSEDVARARAAFQNQYVVLMTLTREGLAKFNALAETSYGRPSPQDQVAIDLNGIVQSNPAFQTPNFYSDIQITGNFSRSEVEKLARIVNSGTPPMKIKRVTSTDDR